jgi:hypothetical protein
LFYINNDGMNAISRRGLSETHPPPGRGSMNSSPGMLSLKKFLSGNDGKNQKQYEKQKENSEQDFGDRNGGRGNTGKSQCPGNQRNDQKDKSPFKHAPESQKPRSAALFVFPGRFHCFWFHKSGAPDVFH